MVTHLDIWSDVSIETVLQIYQDMVRIRAVEEEIAARYAEQKMRCPVHLSTGQEAVPAAMASILNDSDYAISTHRGHAHYLGKGGSLERMLAEIYGKASGCSKGRGGSMHLIDLDVNFMGTSAIVGNSIPIGVGFGLTIDRQKRDEVSCIFLGEGATEQGVFYESLNFAATQNLPIIFVVENNLYSVYSPLEVRRHADFSLCDLTNSVGISASRHDGNDAIGTFKALRSAVSHVRRGKGPYLIEFSVYRWREHCGPNFDNDLGYRSIEEFESWKSIEPVQSLRRTLIENLPNLEKIETEFSLAIHEEIREAFDFAEKSDFPNIEDAFAGEFRV